MACVHVLHKSIHTCCSHDAANQPISPVMMNGTNFTFNFCVSSLHVLQLKPQVVNCVAWPMTDLIHSMQFPSLQVLILYIHTVDIPHIVLFSTFWIYAKYHENGGVWQGNQLLLTIAIISNEKYLTWLSSLLPLWLVHHITDEKIQAANQSLSFHVWRMQPNMAFIHILKMQKSNYFMFLSWNMHKILHFW